MKTVLAFGTGVLVGALLAFAASLSFGPDHPVRTGAEGVLSGACSVLEKAPARIAAALEAVIAPEPEILRRRVVSAVRMTRSGVVLSHFILPDDAGAASVSHPENLPPDIAETRPERAAADAKPEPPSPQAKNDRPVRLVEKAGPDRMYALALEAYEAGRNGESRQRFAAFLREHPGHALVPNALYWTGEAWYDEGRYDRAFDSFARVVREYPRHAKSPDAMLKMVYSAMRQGRPAEARAWLDRLEARYPDSAASRLGRQARGRLEGKSGDGTMVASHG